MPKQPTITSLLGAAIKIVQNLPILINKWIDSAVLIQLLLNANISPETIT